MENLEKVNLFFRQYLNKIRLKTSFLFCVYTFLNVVLCLVYQKFISAAAFGFVTSIGMVYLILGVKSRHPQNEHTIIRFKCYYVCSFLAILAFPYESCFISCVFIIPFLCYFFNSIEDLLGNDTLHWGYALHFEFGFVFLIVVLVIKNYVNDYFIVENVGYYISIVRMLNIAYSSVAVLSILYDLRTVKKTKDYIDQFAVVIDELTQVYNRKILKQLDKSAMYNVAFFDLDFFKKINDTYGHDAGDVVLSSFAKLVIHTMKIELDQDNNSTKLVSSDFIFLREGGEEFILLANNELGKEKFINLVKKICTEASSWKYFVSEEKTVSVTVSSGIFIMEEMIPLEQAIIQADKQIYLAKNNGRNCIYMNDEKLE